DGNGTRGEPISKRFQLPRRAIPRRQDNAHKSRRVDLQKREQLLGASDRNHAASVQQAHPFQPHERPIVEGRGFAGRGAGIEIAMDRDSQLSTGSRQFSEQPVVAPFERRESEPRAYQLLPSPFGGKPGIRAQLAKPRGTPFVAAARVADYRSDAERADRLRLPLQPSLDVFRAAKVFHHEGNPRAKRARRRQRAQRFHVVGIQGGFQGPLTALALRGSTRRAKWGGGGAHQGRMAGGQGHAYQPAAAGHPPNASEGGEVGGRGGP